MEKNSTEKEIQEKFMRFQMLQQHIDQISEHVNILNQQNADLEISKTALEDFEKSSEGEMLAPIANGIFVKALIKDDKKILVNVGADVVVEKSVKQVVEMLVFRQKDMIKRINDAQRMIQEYSQQANNIYKEVEEMQSNVRKA